MAKVFISYRHQEPDATVAIGLAAALADHEVFIDTKLLPGQIWGNIIQDHLENADFLIALISPAGAASPMVVAEIAAAHKLNVAHQNPSIIPVLLNGGFELEYPLSGYLGRFQQTAWNGPADTPALIDSVRQALVVRPDPRRPAPQRAQMIERVHSFWVEGVLDQSLYRVARIQLDLKPSPDAVVHGFDGLVQRPREDPRPLAPGTRLIDVFDDNWGQLLILGAPGSGKTTLLLELTRDLLDRARQDEAHRIPIVFVLSSWALERKKLDEWMISELNRYDVPKKLARDWIAADQILPLLDGLDEVAAEYRDACVDAINTWHGENAFVQLVVSSRLANYEALSSKLSLRAAFVVQPLTRSRIQEYVESGRPQLASLSQALTADDKLWEFLDTPLVISVMALALHGTTDAPAHSHSELFDRYVDEMFSRDAKLKPYSEQQVRRWMNWLASNLVRGGQTVFLVEDVVPEWFLARQKARYATGVVAAATVFLSSATLWLVAGLDRYLSRDTTLAGAFFNSDRFLFNDQWWHEPLLMSPLATCLALLHGRTAGPVSSLRIQWPGVRRFLAIVLRDTALGSVAGALLGYVGCRTIEPGEKDLAPRFALYFGLMGAATFALAGTVRALLAARLADRKAEAGHLLRRSLYSALVCLAGAILLTGASAFYSHWSDFDPLLFGIGSFLGWIGLFVALERGGYFLMRHYLARFLLWSTGRAPWNYNRLLDTATRLVFLRKLGGSYIFVHRLLMDHFAMKVRR